MMFKFGVQVVKILAMICTSLIILLGIGLALVAGTFKSRWGVNTPELGSTFETPASFAFYFSFVLMLVALFGLLGVCINSFGIGIIYIILISLVILIQLIGGLKLWFEVRSTHSKTMQRLKSSIENLPPVKLDKIQKNFHCCGIVKYTDYLNLWQMWGTNVSSLTTTKSSKAPKPNINSTKPSRKSFKKVKGKNKGKYLRNKRNIYENFEIYVFENTSSIIPKKISETFKHIQDNVSHTRSKDYEKTILALHVIEQFLNHLNLSKQNSTDNTQMNISKKKYDDISRYFRTLNETLLRDIEKKGMNLSNQNIKFTSEINQYIKTILEDSNLSNKTQRFHKGDDDSEESADSSVQGFLFPKIYPKKNVNYNQTHMAAATIKKKEKEEDKRVKREDDEAAQIPTNEGAPKGPISKPSQKRETTENPETNNLERERSFNNNDETEPTGGKQKRTFFNFVDYVKNLAESAIDYLQTGVEEAKPFLDKVGAYLWGNAQDLYEYVIPGLLRKWIAIFMNYIRSWYDWVTSPVRKVMKWWFGSGWDNLIFQEITKDKKAILPFSCCRNPSKPCFGAEKDTWQDGCRSKLSWYWKSENLALSTMLLCTVVPCLMSLSVMLVFISAIREKYYF